MDVYFTREELELILGCVEASAADSSGPGGIQDPQLEDLIARLKYEMGMEQ